MKKLKFFTSFMACWLLFGGCAFQSNNSTNMTAPITTTTTTPPIVVEPTFSKVSLVGVGDNLIHEVIFEEAARNATISGLNGYDFSPMYTEVADLIQNADLAFLNQETILGGDEFKPSGYPTFNTPTIMAQQMIDLGFDMFNQASNHSVDKGAKGIRNAAALWREKMANYDIIMSGIYDSAEDRQTIRTIERNGITFALLAYTYGTNGITIPESYMVPLLDKAQIKADVEAARALSDVVLVSVQWGTENTFEINWQQKEFAKYFNEVGVDVVIGHHPHTIQPIDYLVNAEGKETVVIYSLGNFIGGMLNKYNSLGGMVGMDFIKDLKTGEISVENVSWTPFVIHFDGDSNNIMSDRYNFKIIPLYAYTEEQASQHALNGYNGQTITKQDYIDKTIEVIGDKAKIIY